MQEFYYFKQNSTPEISAAIVGISKVDWICVLHQEKPTDAYRKMTENAFDILPRINKNGEVNAYYHTTEWGKYSEQYVKWSKIEQKDCLYYLTHIKDVIRLMCTTGRNFYFLTNHSAIIGLITISNLNCKHVALFYYNLLCQLEKNLGQFILRQLQPEEIITSLEEIGKEKELTSSLNTVKRYREDADKGVDASVIEYLYLSDIFLLISKHQLYELLEYKNRGDFEKNSGKLNKLRNCIAHPNKSIVRGHDSLNDLWKANLKIEELEEKLKKFS